MPKFIVQGMMTVSCWTEVDAETEEEAARIADSREVADAHIDGGYPNDEYWHFDNDGVPEIKRFED